MFTPPVASVVELKYPKGPKVTAVGNLEKKRKEEKHTAHCALNPASSDSLQISFITICLSNWPVTHSVRQQLTVLSWFL